jgi:replicative DNA helicase
MQDTLVNLDAERTLLACAMNDSDSLYRIMPVIEASDFSLDSHRRIFQAIADLAEAGKPVDELTLSNELGAKNQLVCVGGAGFISGLSEKVDAGLARITNVEHYGQLVLEKSRRRQVRAAAERVGGATLDHSVSTDECLQMIQESLLQIEATSRKFTARHIKEVIPEMLRELEAQASNQGLVGMSTGLHSLDMATGGIRPGEVWTVGALPGRGKTAFGVQVALANAKAGTPVAAFSLEMQDTEINKRFLCATSSFAAMQIRNPQTIRSDRWTELVEAVASLSELPIYVDSRPSLKIQELLASARLYVRRYKVKLVIVDYLRLVDAPGRELRERVGYVANALRELAKSERIGLVMLSQLRRPEGGMNSKPTMLDLKESGDIENHSHVVLLPFLPVGDDGGPRPEEQLLIIGKNRNGRIGSLPVYFDEKRLQFCVRTLGDVARSEP